MKKIIPSSNELKTPLFSNIQKSILAEFESTYLSVPFFKDALDELILVKKELLLKYYNINVTTKSMNKARDFICEFKFDINGGYQTYNAVKQKIINSFINSLEKAKNMPDVLYCMIDNEENMLNLVDLSIDFEVKKRNWADNSFLSDSENKDIWSLLSDNELDLISSVYSASQVVVSSGENSYLGFGNLRQDLEYLEEQFGIGFCGVEHIDYHYLSNQYDDRVVLMLTKPKDIDSIINDLKKIK